MSGSLQSEEASSPEEERTYKRLLELRDLFHAIIGELDSPTSGLPRLEHCFHVAATGLRVEKIDDALRI